MIYDIETVPNAFASQMIADRKYSPPANYKDPEKIERWLIEKRESEMEKAALHWTTGKCCCIGVSNGVQKNFFTSTIEREILEDFAIYVLGKLDEVGRNEHGFPAISTEPTYFVGKSNEYYDRPFLIGRYLANNLPVPRFLKHQHVDIDKFFGYRSDQACSLDNMAKGIGIESKLGDGSQVYAWYQEEDWGHIIEYCERDLDITEEIYLRYNRDYEVK